MLDADGQVIVVSPYDGTKKETKLSPKELDEFDAVEKRLNDYAVAVWKGK